MTTNKQLRALAEKATPGPWARDEGNDVSVSEDGDEGYWEWQEAGPAQFHGMRRGQAGADADFCAAANPDTVLALLDEIEALQAENEKLRKDAERYNLLASMIVAESIGAAMTPQEEALFEALNTITHLGEAEEVHAVFDTAMQADNPC